MFEILAEERGTRQHGPRFQSLLKSADDLVRVASAYVTDATLLLGAKARNIRLLTQYSPLDIVCGATSLPTLSALVDRGVQCRFAPERPKLHAKVYIFGDSTAIVSSANLTRPTLQSNIEVGVGFSGKGVSDLIDWYERLWKTARPIDAAELWRLKEETSVLRREYLKLKNRAKMLRPAAGFESATDTWANNVTDLFKNARQFFVCNTDRRDGERTATGAFDREQRMYAQGYVAAWESFAYPDHMERVRRGDAIFAFAKGVGILGIGRAQAASKTVDPGARGRLYPGGSVEWRVPVSWLDWRDEFDACPWDRPHNSTFLDISGERYAEFRQGVEQHFLEQG